MKLYTFTAGDEHYIGVEVTVDGERRLLDIGAALRVQGGAGDVPANMLGLLQAGPDALDAVRDVAAGAADLVAGAGDRLLYAFDEVQILAPILLLGKILCSGINYHGHLLENPAAVLPATPFFFAKLPNTVMGPGQPIVHPALTQQLDYEVELAVVVGRRMRATPAAEAMDCLAGYTILHDVSARDVQFKDNQITLGKNFDTFAPIGPCIVTADEIRDPADLWLRSWVNDTLMQDGSTRDWVFSLPVLLAHLAQVMTLEPGDIVTTGTPAGVGVFRSPQVFLWPGDRVVLEVEGIGRLENPVVAAGSLDAGRDDR